MAQNDPQEVIIGRFAADIAFSIFKDPNQADIIKIMGQFRLNILEVSHMNRHIIRILMTVGIDQTAFSGQIHTGDRAGFFCQYACDCTAAGTDFQYLFRAGKGNPVHNVLTLIGQMIENRPVFPFFYD